MGLALLLGCVGPSIGAEVIYSADFEGGSLTPLTTSGNAPSVQTTITRGGKYGMKSYLHRSTSTPSYRTEVTVGTQNCAVIGQEYWYGFSVHLPEPYAPDDLEETVAQWHQIKDDADTTHNPPIALSIKNGQWLLKIRWAATQPTLAASVQGVQIPLGPHSTGEWTDWVFRIKWAYDGSGVLQVWKNGAVVATRNGGNTYNDVRGPWFKMGIYKSLWNAERFNVNSPVTDRTLYHDELRIARGTDGYQLVAPGSKPTAPTLKLVKE
jgi:hypothetical protein